MADAVQHAARLLVVLDLDRVPDAAQAEGPQRLELAVRRAVLRLGLRHLGHQAEASSVTVSSAAGASSATGSSPSTASSSAPSPTSLVRPSTSAIERPRICATSSGVRRSWRPAS